MKQAHPEVLARHWTEAGEIEPRLSSGRGRPRLLERATHSPGREELRASRRLLNLLAEWPEHDLRELELRQSSSWATLLIKGWAARETVNATERLTKLVEKSGNLEALARSLALRSLRAFFAGDYPTAGALLDQGLKLAQRHGNPTLLAGAYHGQLFQRFFRGDLAGAEQHFQAGLRFSMTSFTSKFRSVGR